MKRIIVLGCTGSVGTSALDVVRSLPHELRVVGLSCRRNCSSLERIASELSPEAVAIVEPKAADQAVCRFSGKDGTRAARVYTGDEGILRMIEETPADIVLNAVSGAAGLRPSLAALRAGKDLALANKESMVIAGALVFEQARTSGKRVIPVDSEHAALASMLHRLDPATIEELILTASGGAFRDRSLEELAGVTLADALRHPTWKMGTKITVDSASMANKGLEVIEAHRLFGVPIARTRVLIHPQSCVHSLLRTRDGTMHAELSTPDMRIPIQNALTLPALLANRVSWLQLAGMTLEFRPVDMRKYRMLDIAYSIAESDERCIVYNAANEEAASSFMEGAIPFLGIPDVVAEVLSQDWPSQPRTVEDILAIDEAARHRALSVIQGRWG